MHVQHTSVVSPVLNADDVGSMLLSLSRLSSHFLVHIFDEKVSQHSTASSNVKVGEGGGTLDKLVGISAGDSYLHHISSTTSANVTLRGRGSGMYDRYNSACIEPLASQAFGRWPSHFLCIL